MSEEHGYQRTGKKCREKFENLYKYYKKTKEGKAGRQDGKHYRFFRQLEALYGDNTSTSTPTLIQDTNFTPMPANNQDKLFCSQKLFDSLSLSNSSDFDTTTSSDDNDLSTGANDSSDKRKKRRGGMRSWKVKIKEFINSQMRKLVEKQEEWLERLTRTLEQKEQERMIREEEWRKQEASRIDREYMFWAKERAWIDARDNALMDAIQKAKHDQNENNEAMLNKGVDCHTWQESEFTRSSNDCIMMRRRNKEGNNKRIRKGNSSYFQSSESLYNQGGSYGEMSGQDVLSSPSNPSTSNVVTVDESCFRFQMSDGGNNNLWENYGLKLSRGGNQ